MKLATTLLAPAALCMALPTDDGKRALFWTTSHDHPEQYVPYPVYRNGHNRGTPGKVCDATCQQEDTESRMSTVMEMKIKHHNECAAAGECPINRPSIYGKGANGAVSGKCVDGLAAGRYECRNADILSFVPIAELGSTYDASDIWGWYDAEYKREIAIIGMMDGTAFVDVTDPKNPNVLGNLPQTGKNLVIWSDMKVFNDHVFIVRESKSHGMQVYDLTKLRDLYDNDDKHVTQLAMDAFYNEGGALGSTHNIVINEETAFAYLVGSKTCRGGLHAVDIKNPLKPTFAGCFASDGYTHDAQCVVYSGPDSRYQGSEICFNYNEDTLTIVDVSDKDDMKMLARVGYDNAFYTHQGWLTADQSFLLLNDELDESRGPTKNTRTMIWDVQDLEDPHKTGSHYAVNEAVDHNLYIRGDYAYLSNYCDGLRVLDVKNIQDNEVPEVAYVDIADYCNSADFEGAWSSYPYFPSGHIVVSSIELGLFTINITAHR